MERSNSFNKLNYAYTFEVASLAAGASSQTSINIESDAKFHWLRCAYFVDLAGAAQTDSSRVIPLVTIQLTDTGSGRQFFDKPIAIPSFFGTGQLPVILPVTQIFAPNSTIKAEFVNFSAATTYANLRLSMIGFKQFNSGR